jgi:hypothetical protein
MFPQDLEEDTERDPPIFAIEHVFILGIKDGDDPCRRVSGDPE